MKSVRLVLLLMIMSMFSLMPISPAFSQETLTVGIVQKFIHNGMSQDEVALALGSPNIVTQDANGKETWIYDKMSSTIIDKNKNQSSIENATAVRNGWNSFFTFVTLGLVNKDRQPELKEVSQVTTSQSTLTIIIKFNKYNCVESYTYHSSKF